MSVGELNGSYRQIGIAIQLADVHDPAIDKYSVDCGEDDFASPLIGLLAEAVSNRKTLDQQNRWVVDVYDQIVEKCIHNPLKKQIAIASSRSLINSLNRFYSQHPFHSYYRVHYNTAYQDKIDPHSVEAVVDHLFKQYGNAALEHNPIPFFTYVYAIPETVLWGKRTDELRSLLLERGLKKIFPYDGELSDAYKVLYPAIAGAFAHAKAQNFTLNDIPSPDDEANEQYNESGCCDNCIIL